MVICYLLAWNRVSEGSLRHNKQPHTPLTSCLRIFTGFNWPIRHTPNPAFRIARLLTTKAAGRFVLGNASHNACKDKDATQSDEECEGNAIIDDDDNSDSEDSVTGDRPNIGQINSSHTSIRNQVSLNRWQYNDYELHSLVVYSSRSRLKMARHNCQAA